VLGVFLPTYNHPPPPILMPPAVSGGPHSPLRCGDSKVAVDAFFIANGKRRQIGIIVGSQADQDLLVDGLDIRKVEGTCIAVSKTYPGDGAIVN
jgi:hypothetical protein